MVTICEFSSLTCVADIVGCEDDDVVVVVVVVNEFEADDEGTERGPFDGTTTLLPANCGGNGPESTTSCRGTGFDIGESENEDACAGC